jgi:hypothetical protein
MHSKAINTNAERGGVPVGHTLCRVERAAGDGGAAEEMYLQGLRGKEKVWERSIRRH